MISDMNKIALGGGTTSERPKEVIVSLDNREVHH